MEAHPPYRLPGGCAPLDSPCDGRAASGGHSQTPARGRHSLDSGLGDCCLNGGSDHPPGPLPGRKGEDKEKKKVYGGTSSITACQWGCTPLDSPCDGRAASGGHSQTPARGRHSLDSGLGDCCLNGGSDHPPGPLPGRKGEDKEKKKVYGGTSSIPPASGVAPLWTPPAMVGLPLGDTPRPLPGGGTLWTPAWGTVASMVARTIPLAPFLEGRGGNKEKKKVYGGTSSIPPASGAVPLWTPAWARGTPPDLLPKGRCPSGLPL